MQQNGISCDQIMDSLNYSDAIPVRTQLRRHRGEFAKTHCNY